MDVYSVERLVLQLIAAKETTGKVGADHGGRDGLLLPNSWLVETEATVGAADHGGDLN